VVVVAAMTPMAAATAKGGLMMMPLT